VVDATVTAYRWLLRCERVWQAYRTQAGMLRLVASQDGVVEVWLDAALRPERGVGNGAAGALPVAVVGLLGYGLHGADPVGGAEDGV